MPGLRPADLCWNKEYIATFNAFNDATPAILERGRAESGDFAPYFASRCIHFPQLVSAISTEVTALLLRRQYRRQLEAERQRTRGQYAQLSELVAQAMAAPDQQAEEGNTLAWDVAMGSTPRRAKGSAATVSPTSSPTAIPCACSSPTVWAAAGRPGGRAS